MSGKSSEIVLAHLDTLPALKIAEDSAVADKFVSLFNVVHQTTNGAQIYETEKFYFQKLLADTPDLQSCSKLSLYGVFMDVAVNKLSLDPTKKLCYVIPRSHNSAPPNATPKWEKRARLEISPYGELAIRQNAGQIKDADNPVIVYEGDTFEPYIDELTGSKRVKYHGHFPRKSNKIIAAFIRITRIDGSIDYQWIAQEEINIMRAASAKQNKNTTGNALYGSVNDGIHPGFLAAKMIKHAFKSYPKVKVPGKFSELQTDTDLEIDYGIPETKTAIAAPDIKKVTEKVAETVGDSKEKNHPFTDVDESGEEIDDNLF